MRFGHNQTTRNRARSLRKEATLPERLLWAALRRQQTGLRFRRQHPVGPFVLDFYCPALRLAVEVDGRQHEMTVEADAARDRALAAQGIRVLRIAAADVLADPDAVAVWIGMRAPSGPADHLPR